MVKKEIESAALPPLRVLILEDNPGDANLTVRLLERGGAKVTFDVTDSREVFQQRLESADFDVILADFNLRGWTAFDALEILSSSGRDIPLIVMTGTLGDEAAAECIKRGAADFILKDRPARLPAAIQRARDEKRLRTETKQAERSLIEETNLLLTLMDNLPDGIYFKDRESRFTRINMALAKLFGLSDPALAIGKTDRDFFAAEHAQAAYNDEQQIIRTGQPMVDKEEKEIWPDGRVTWSSTTKMPVHDARGNITGTFGVSRNITERKLAEEDLLFKSALLEAQSETTIDGILVVNEMDQILMVNNRFVELWNLPEGATSIKDDSKMLQLVIPQTKDPEAFVEKVRYLNSHADETSRDELELKDGRFFDRYSSPLQGRAGNVYGRIWYFRDISERKRSEVEKLRLVTAIEQSAEAVVITNPKGEIEYVNPAFTLITGYSREEALGQNPRILKSNKQPSFYKQLWETILAGKPWHGELTNQRKDGAHYTEQMSIAPVKGAHGEVTHFIATKMDVTERRSLEEQLQRAAKMEAVGRLAGGVAHDFNNLLTVINGYSEILRARVASDPKASEYLHEISGAGERAAGLTRQLLAFSRRQVLAPQVLDLNAVVQNLEKMLRRLIWGGREASDTS